MKKFMLFTVSALALAALALAAFTPGGLAAGKVFSAARTAIAGSSQSVGRHSPGASQPHQDRIRETQRLG